MMLTMGRPRPVRMITAWTMTACRRSFYTFAHSKRFRAAIELLAIWLVITAGGLILIAGFQLLFFRCVIAHMANLIVPAHNDR